MSPANSSAAIVPMRARVVWALRTLGLRKAGTPFATASTPVRAEQPLENARSTSRMTAAWPRFSACTPYSALDATGGLPRRVWASPTTTMTPTDPMNT